VSANCPACGAKLEAKASLCAACRTERLPAALGSDHLFRPAEATVIAQRPYELRPRFVGRRQERALLDATLADVTKRRRFAAISVVGPPGIGKTRLYREFARTLNPREVRLLYGSATGSDVAPLAPFTRLLSSRLGIGTHDATADAQRKIIAQLDELMPGPRGAEAAHLVAHLLHVGFPGSTVVQPLAAHPRELEARCFIAVRRVLQADAQVRPLILVLDDLEQASGEAIRLCGHLAQMLAEMPVLMVLLARPGVDERHPDLPRAVPAVRIPLGPLVATDVDLLLADLLTPIGTVPPPLAAHARTLGGNPRILVELCRLLLEADVITRGKGGTWVLDEARLKRLPLPATHDELTQARLRTLPPAERDLLEKGAVCGEIFWLDAVVALVRGEGEGKSDEPDGPRLEEIVAAGDALRVAAQQTLARLAERGWVVHLAEGSLAGEREYRFAYPLLSRLIYAGIEPAARARAHKEIARWLALRPELSEQRVAFHFRKGGDHGPAARWYRRAADAARAAWDHDEAIRLYKEALEVLGSARREERMHVWHDLGSVYELIGEFDLAIDAYERMLRLSWAMSSRAKGGVALNKLGRVWRRKGELLTALSLLERAEELFEQAGDERGIAGSLDDIGQTLWLLGRYDEAEERIGRALRLRSQGGDRRSIAHSLSTLGRVQKDRGRPSEAELSHRQALDLRRETGDQVGVVGSLFDLAELAMERGDSDAARIGFGAALAEAEKIGALPLKAELLIGLGEASHKQRQEKEARGYLEGALALADEIEEPRLVSGAACALALLELAEANVVRARELAERAYEVALASSHREAVGRALVALGQVHGATIFDADQTMFEVGTLSPEDYFRRAVELFRDLGNDGELARALERMGRYRLERADVSGGKALLQEALVLYQRLGSRASDDVARVIREV
jgi:tetratricopeptide (TPR) repeat protein